MGLIVGLVFGAISIVAGIIMAIMGAFVSNIIIFDSVVLALAGGITANTLLHIHPAFCLLIGIGLFFGLMFLQHSKYGFWIIGGLLTLFWSFVFGFIAYTIARDMIWFYVIWGLSAVFVAGLHFYAREQIV